MVDFHPIPLGPLVWRAFREFERYDRIFDLPRKNFWCPDPSRDLSVVFQGLRAGTALGPAAGPQTQLVPNIVLSWLGGGRILELKTVQVMDELEIPRPCIDARNICYNVEWSQELRVSQSLEEYVAAQMLIRMLEEENVLETPSHSTSHGLQLDVSLGYDLAGIQSEKISAFLGDLQDCRAIVDRLRPQIPAPWKKYRDLDFANHIVHNITLSTFHGCPPEEIEQITAHLLTEVGVHMTVKMNPTLLGREQVAALLHDRLGYENIQLHEVAFERDIQFDTAVEVMRRLRTVGDRVGRRVAVKFSNTLEVVNKGEPFSEKVIYLSGQPLHIITTTLAGQWRDAVGDEFPISFSAGVDARNFADLVALGFAPVTTCTDLLRPGGYGRMHKYLRNLESRMTDCGAIDIDNFILRAFGQGRQAILDEVEARGKPALEPIAQTALATLTQPDGDVLAAIRTALDTLAPQIRNEVGDLAQRVVSRAQLLNTPLYVQAAPENPRYTYARNHKSPRKIGSQLVLFDCINCDKCIPVCPNNANFFYEIEPVSFEYTNYRVQANHLVPNGQHTFRVEKGHQIGTFHDYCNDCGNCDTFCPEDGGPYIEKPSFFGSRASWEQHANRDGFHIWKERGNPCILGRIQGRQSSLRIDIACQEIVFEDQICSSRWSANPIEAPQLIELTSRNANHSIPENHPIDMGTYHTLQTLLRGVLSESSLHHVNALVSSAEEETA